MLESWFASFLPPYSYEFPGCDVDHVMGLCSGGQWSVFLRQSTIDLLGEQGFDFLCDEKAATSYLEGSTNLCRRLSQRYRAMRAFPEEINNSDLKIYFNSFFEDYTKLQAYYQASADPFIHTAVAEVQSELAARYKDPEAHLALIMASKPHNLGTFQSKIAWLKLLTNTQSTATSSSDILALINKYECSYAHVLAGGESIGASLAPRLLEKFEHDKKGGRDFESEILQLEQEEKKREQKREDALENAKLTNRGYLLAQNLSRLGSFRLEIRETFTELAHHSHLWFEVVYKRFGVSETAGATDLHRTLNREEILSLADGVEVDQDAVFARYNQSALVTNNKRLQYYSGAEAEKLVYLSQEKAPDDSLKELTGTIGYPAGVVIGRAFVVPALLDYHDQTAMVECQLQKGDILVIGMTYPSVVPACENASAIVTDFGGATAHAALLAREYGIPCVVGTRWATRLFSTGDTLSVDSDKGIVRRLKSIKNGLD